MITYNARVAGGVIAQLLIIKTKGTYENWIWAPITESYKGEEIDPDDLIEMPREDFRALANKYHCFDNLTDAVVKEALADCP